MKIADGDMSISPHTGWTRRHWEQLADAQLAAVRPYASPGHALIDLPGPASVAGRHSDGLEGFARTFLLAAFRLAQWDSPAAPEVAQWYAAGLAAGTDPRAADRWPRLADIRQARVECASIALALHESRRWIWDRLDDAVRQRLVDWMAGMLDPWVIPDNNWVWFRAVTEAFLRSVGGPWRAADIDHAIDRTETWYAGDGWYADGGQAGNLRNFDHYCGWAMQFYPLWFCRIAGPDAEPGLADRYRARLRRYLADAVCLVGSDGAPLLQGRSLTYRYAMLAPFWAGAIFDATPLPAGLTRRLASGVVKYFGTAAPQPLGWHGPFEAIRQPYSGPGSPYWSSKGFAGLVLPADHPVWTAVEQPLPIECGDVSCTIQAPGWLVSGTAADGIVRVVNHGTDHAPADGPGVDDPMYARLGYATAAVPDSTPRARSHPLDSHATLLDEAGDPAHRTPLRRLYVTGRAGVSRYRAHWPVGTVPRAFSADPPVEEFVAGPEVSVASVLNGAWEVRLVRVADEPAGRWRLRVGGYCVADDEPLVVGDASVRRPDGLTSVVVGLAGLPDTGVAQASGTNALGAHSATPWVESDGPVRPGQVYAALVGLFRRSAGVPAIRLTESGTDVLVTWPDGSLDKVRLP